ncbi:MAG: glutamate racemase [Candidatus Omnitrophota bacterium]
MNKNECPAKNKPIGIFDSGIGGLTVVKEISRRMPQETLCYFGDTARVPYGTKSAETVKRYSVEITRFLHSHDSKIVIVACNTASSVALEEIRNAFPGPAIGVVEPGVRAALRATKNGRIGVIGTKSTINSGAYQKKLLELDRSLHIAAAPCPLFVPLAEEGWVDDPITLETAKRYLTPLRGENVDVLILGCTHFPLLEGIIRQAMGGNVTLINSAEEVSREVEAILKENNLFSPRKTYKDLFYASDDIAGFEKLHRRICGKGDVSFVEAPSDFFAIVQEVRRFRGKIFADAIQWFEPLP